MWYLITFVTGYLFFPLSILLVKQLISMVALMIRLHARSVGVYVEDHGAWSYFFPRTPRARLVAREICQGRYRQTWVGKGWRIPYDDRRKVYEKIAHHGRFPQEVTTRSDSTVKRLKVS